jgi:hypothetical protein
MNTDIRIITTFRNSRKRKRLARQLGDGAVVCLVDLWIAVALSRPEGRLEGWDAQDIADEAGWTGEPEVFVNTLLDIGFLDRLPDSTLAIHNWEKHNPWAAGANRRSLRAKKAAALRWGFEVEDNTPARQAVPEAPPSQQALAAPDRQAPAPQAAMPKDEGAPGPDSPGHPYNNGGQDANLCQEHPLSNAQTDIEHGFSNARTDIEHSLGNARTDIEHGLSNAQTDIEHCLSNAPSPSPSPDPYPYPNPSPSPSPGPSPAAGEPPAAAGSVRARASPKKGQTDHKNSFKKIPPCPHGQVISLYHRCLPGNPRVESWTARNRADLSLAWQADPARQSLDWWQDFFLHMVAPNRFLTGKKGDFAASLGWIAKPEVFGRILAGHYRDFTPNRDQGPALWFMEQTHARSGQDGLCQGNGSPLPDVRPGGAARQHEDGHLL